MRSLALEAFDGLTGRFICLGLLNGCWLGLFAASACALLFRAAPRLSHPVRHTILFVAIATVASGPVVLTAVQRLVRTLPTRSQSAQSEFEVIAGMPSVGAGLERTGSGIQYARGRPAVPRHLRFPGLALSRAVALAVRIQPILVLVWLLVVAGLVLVLGLGLRGTNRLCRQADPAPPIIHERARRLARRLRLGNPPQVLIHPRLAEPCLCGLLRPVILLPGAWIMGAPTERLDAILAHELAHARRLDPLANLGQRVVESLLFFHPAVHWLSRSLRRERELCTDALAVRLTRNPLALAEALESVARLRLHSRSSAGLPIAGTSLGGHNQSLLPRIQELIGMKPTRPRFPVWTFAGLPAAGLVALVAASFGMADDRPSNSVRPDAGPSSAPTRSRAVASMVLETGPTVDGGVHQPLASDRQISFEVRYVSGIDANSWRNRFEDRLKVMRQDADVSAWLIDGQCLSDLLTLAQGDTVVDALMAPKITAFENAKARITNRRKQYYVSGLEKLETSRGPAFKPIVKDVEVGYRIDMTGSFLPDGTRLVVDLRDSSLITLHNLVREGRTSGGDIGVSYQVPTAIDRNIPVSCDVPDGSSLVISAGLEEPTVRAGETVGLARGLLESVGLASFRPKAVVRERLVIIRPRKIILESEERRTSSPRRSKLSPKKSESVDGQSDSAPSRG